MKKILIILLSIAMTLNFISAAAEREIKVTIDGKEVMFPDQKPIAENQRTLVPVRFVSEALGANVDWVQSEQKVKIEKDGQLIELVLGEKNVKAGDKTIELDVAAKAYNQRTLVPLRFISEALGCNVEWVQETYTVVITTSAEKMENDLVNVPVKSEAIIEIEGPKGEDNPYNIDFSILILLYKPIEPQYEDAQSLLEARFGENNATVKEVMSYIKSKDVRAKELPQKKWYINGQTIRVISSYNSMSIALQVWRDVK